MLRSTERVVENSYEIKHVMANIVRIGRAPMIHVEQFQIEVESIANHNDVVCM